MQNYVVYILHCWSCFYILTSKFSTPSYFNEEKMLSFWCDAHCVVLHSPFEVLFVGLGTCSLCFLLCFLFFLFFLLHCVVLYGIVIVTFDPGSLQQCNVSQSVCVPYTFNIVSCEVVSRTST